MVFDWFINLSYPFQAFLACIFTWFVTSLGSAVVFLFKKVNKTVMDAMLGFAAGVMIAATFFSLLSPAIEMANNLEMIAWLVVSIGFFCGGLLLYICDKIFDHFTKKQENNSNKRIVMLISSITLHNIPDGLWNMYRLFAKNMLKYWRRGKYYEPIFRRRKKENNGTNCWN